MMSNPRAVLLLSGGLDSATTLAIAQSEGYEVTALSCQYGQRHAIELDAARDVARAAGVSAHHIISIDLRPIGGSALTGDIEVPKNREVAEMATGIPDTYVPARNTIFLSYALGWAEVSHADHIWLGVNALDYSGYPDCRPEYVEQIERAFNLATKRQVEGHQLFVHAPLIKLSKAEIIARGIELGVDYSLTRSCYDPTAAGAACGGCDSCKIRLAGFAANGLEDPAPYAPGALAA
jgi:7-cyano-7-deazaguanine synthase